MLDYPVKPDNDKESKIIIPSSFPTTLISSLIKTGFKTA
ncbi:MAG: hypothetical protein CSYNP_02418 [Syntrophus sp. SKADARSKE-3]|nr:hypothetical protein [Syntrophus sp. SKADARSKE-3]